MKWLFVPLLLLTGCMSTKMATIDPPPPATSICDTVFKPIAWSTKDTDETILDVKAHNAAYKSYCHKDQK